MTIGLAQSKTTWAEDTALLRSNRSAVPGAKTEGGIESVHSIPPLSPTLRDWPECAKPSRQDAVKSATACHLPLTNTNPPQFHLPLNQNSSFRTESFWEQSSYSLLVSNPVS